MFTIKSTQLMEWPAHAFTLRKGENAFPSRASVPAALWPKLERFRKLKLLEFPDAKEGEKDAIKLEELSLRQLYQMSKDDLIDLAKAEGVSVAEGAGKKAVLDALAERLPKKPDPEGETKTVELTEAALSALSIDELRAVAGELKLEHKGLGAKKLVDRILASQVPPSGNPPVSSSTTVTG